MPHSSPSSSGKFRILEIKLESANLDVKNNTRVYVKLAIHPSRELQTSVKRLSPGSKPALWDEKFIFLVSADESENNDKPRLLFKIFRARKFLKDKLIGTTCCDLKALMFQDHHQQDDVDSVYFDASDDDECSYSDFDDDKEEEDEAEEEDPRYPNMFFRPDNDEIDVEKMLDNMLEPKNDKIMDVKKINPVHALSSSMSLIVNRGSEQIGNLTIEVAELEGFISCIGEYKWRNAAMPYDEFVWLTNPNYIEDKDDKRKMIKKNRKFMISSTCVNR